MPAPVESLSVPCSHCGAPLSADGSTRTPACSFCGTRTALPVEVWRAVRPAEPAPRADGPSASRAALWIGVSVAGVVLLGGAAGALSLARGGRPSSPRGVGVAGAPCNGMDWACSADGATQLRCDGDRFVAALTCRGPKGCRVANDGDAVSCDYTYAAAGDPCNVHDDACSVDHRAILHCDGATFTVSATCKGASGCAITPHDQGATLSCDDHVADPGDLCKGEDWACSPDRKALLACKDGRFVQLGTCKGPEACAVSKNPSADTTTVSCDSNVADPGDLCRDGFACRSDGKALLRCVDAHFTLAESCPRGCAPSSDKLSCRK